MVNHMQSATIAFLLLIVTIGAGQLLKSQLSTTRQGAVFAGLLGSKVFLLGLTAISNFQMANNGTNTKAGLVEVIFALFVGMVAAGMIHRVAITLTLLFSGIILYMLNLISQQRYGMIAGTKGFTQAQTKQKK
uniref:Dolichyl-diphosphooligosaccharide--protein glycosyltransferase subunit KCP2 n=1 Tax=Panagrolaimus sp. JU765 TaxID=591449 RepID=A0AC34QAW8_9BILA